MRPKVYSYIRFSTPEQAKGHSLDRQLNYAKSYAKQNDMVLEERFTMRDEGLSAFHQTHIKRGAFGLFLSAVQTGKVASGSVLIIEGLDRMSRAEPIEAQAILSQIIMSGITVITASDNKVYDRETVKKNPMDLVLSLLIFVRANEESETKSKRVKESIIRQINQWLENGHGKIIRNGQAPYWCMPRKDKSGFDLIPERVKIIKLIIEFYLKGWGCNKIAGYLNDNYKPFNKNKWYTQYISSIMTRKDLIGEKSLLVNGKNYIIPNYYPSVLSNEEFYNLQVAIKKRAKTKGQRNFPGLITGFRTAFCGLCGDVLVSQNYANRAKNGKLTDGLRRIKCNSRSRFGSKCINSTPISVAMIERSILEYCADQMELSSVLGDNDKTTEIKATIASLYQQVKDAEQKIKTGEQSIIELLSNGQTVSVVTNIVEKFKVEHEQLQQKIATLEDDLRFESRNKATDLVQEWQDIKSDVYNLNEETRLLIRQLVKRTFKRIDIFLHGMDKSEHAAVRLLKSAIGTNENTIDMILTFHSNKTRLLSIDKQTGLWINGGNVSFNEKSLTQGLEEIQTAEGLIPA